MSYTNRMFQVDQLNSSNLTNDVTTHAIDHSVPSQDEISFSPTDPGKVSFLLPLFATNENRCNANWAPISQSPNSPLRPELLHARCIAGKVGRISQSESSIAATPVQILHHGSCSHNIASFLFGLKTFPDPMNCFNHPTSFQES